MQTLLWGYLLVLAVFCDRSKLCEVRCNVLAGLLFAIIKSVPLVYSQYESNFASMGSVFHSSLASPHSKAREAFLASLPIADKNVETLTIDSCLDIPVTISDRHHTFFQLQAMLSSKTSASGGGRLQGGMNICVDGGGKVSGAASLVVPPVAIVV